MEDKAIKYAKKLVCEQVKFNRLSRSTGNFVGYQKTYYQTNENINFYMGLANVSRSGEALTVLSSGDHAFNLVTNGARNIETFDVNKLSEYIALGLKKAMILKYNYYEYLIIDQKLRNYDISLEELSDILTSLLPFMEEKYRVFWRQLIDYNYKLQKKKYEKLNLIYLVCSCVISPRTHINNNKYLTDEAYYDELRRNISRTNISFKPVDAIDLTKAYKDKEFDVICLSNIMDYFVNYYGPFWSAQIFYNYIYDLEKITKDCGTIFVNYMFDKYDGYTYNNRVIRDSMVFEEDIEDKFKIIEVPVYASDEIIDGMVLRRVKKGK